MGDGTHAFIQFPFKQQGLDSDRDEPSLYKWMLAPLDLAGSRKFQEVGRRPGGIGFLSVDGSTR